MPYGSITHHHERLQLKNKRAQQVANVIQRSKEAGITPSKALKQLVEEGRLEADLVTERHLRYSYKIQAEGDAALTTTPRKRDMRQVLLDQERVDLAQFAMNSADPPDPHFRRKKLRNKINEILRIRHGQNEHSLTTAELNCLKHPTTLPSDEWFNRFFGEFHDCIPSRTAVVKKDINGFCALANTAYLLQQLQAFIDDAFIDSEQRHKVMELITRLGTEYKNCQYFIETSPMTHDGTLTTTVPEFASSSTSAGSQRNLKLEEKSWEEEIHLASVKRKRIEEAEEKSEGIASLMKKQQQLVVIDDDVDTTTTSSSNYKRFCRQQLELSTKQPCSDGANAIWEFYLSSSHTSDDPCGLSLARSSSITAELDQEVQGYWTLDDSKIHGSNRQVRVYKALKKAYNNKILNSWTEIPLSVKDFQRLKCIGTSEEFDRSKWLNDQVIDFVCLMLKIRECTKRRISDKTYPYQSKYIGNALLTSNIIDRYYGQEDEMMNLTCKRCNVRPFSFDTVIMPFNMNDLHWVFFVIKPKLKLVVGYDSMNNELCFKTDIVPKILYWLEIESKYLEITFCGSDWQFQMYPCPQQHNAMDCGVMMLTGILYTCDNMNLSYSQSTMNEERKRFAADILALRIITDSLPAPTQEDFLQAVTT